MRVGFSWATFYHTSESNVCCCRYYSCSNWKAPWHPSEFVKNCCHVFYHAHPQPNGKVRERFKGGKANLERRVKVKRKREGGGSEKGYVFIHFWLSLYISHTHTHTHTHTHAHTQQMHTHAPVFYDRALYHLNIYCILCGLDLCPLAIWSKRERAPPSGVAGRSVRAYIWLCMYRTLCCKSVAALVTYSCVMHYFINGSQSSTVKPRFSNTDRGSGEDKDGCWNCGRKSRHSMLPVHCYLMLAPRCSTFT